MRARFALGIALLALALLAWLLVRARQPDGDTFAQGIAPDSLLHAAQMLEPSPGPVEEPASSPSRSRAEEPRFEPLPEDPSEIVLHLREEATGAPVPGAEVFVLEKPTWDWSYAGSDFDHPWPDVEELWRARGRRIESDAQGDLRFPIPSEWLGVSARKGELFGALTVGFLSEPDSVLSMVRSSACSVHIRDRAGRAVAGESVVLADKNGNPFWRALSDEGGELRVPNLGWLIAEHCGDSESWFATANDACAVPPVRWFQTGEPAPSAIELLVGDAQRVRLQVVASDGTRVPIDGFVGVSPQPTSGGTSLLHLPRHTNPEIRLVHGSAIVARGEPGGWLDLEVGLAGSTSFEASLRVPARGEAAGEFALRMPEELQVLVLHPTDEQGAPLTQQEFEWVSWAQVADDDHELDAHFDKVHSDEQGVIALAIARRDLNAQQVLDSANRPLVFVYRGSLRARGARELESVPIPFAALGTGAVHDHGALVLARAAPLVRGRIVDDRGRPLAHVRVGVSQLHVWDGDHQIESLAGVEEQRGMQTGGDGAFVIYGSCPGGHLQLSLTREGLLPPRDSEPFVFECGSSPDLQLVLVRAAELRISMRLPQRLDRRLVWLFDDGTPDMRMEEIQSPPGGGVLQRQLTRFQPGTYRATLRELDDSTVPSILVVEEVLLRPGECTLDPRLLDIDLTRFALAEIPPEPEQPGKPIVLRILDSNGHPLSDGRLVEQYGESNATLEWHGGRVSIEPDMQRASLTIWSPGKLAWMGECPERSGELRLQPAPMLRVKFQLPPELRKPDWHFRIEPSVVSTGQGLWDIATRLASPEFDSNDQVAIEIPGEFTLGLDVVAFVLEPNGMSYREGTTPMSVAYTTLEVPAGDEVHVITPTPVLWAAAEKALGWK